MGKLRVEKKGGKWERIWRRRRRRKRDRGGGNGRNPHGMIGIILLNCRLSSLMLIFQWLKKLELETLKKNSTGCVCVCMKVMGSWVGDDGSFWLHPLCLWFCINNASFSCCCPSLSLFSKMKKVAIYITSLHSIFRWWAIAFNSSHIHYNYPSFFFF